MSLKFSFFKNANSVPLAEMLKRKNYNFVLLKKLLLIKENKLIIFNTNCSLVDLKKIKKTIDVKKNYFIFLLVPNNFSDFDFGTYCIKIFYPIKIGVFQKIILDKINSLMFSYKDVIIGSDNFMINCINDKKVYLTETEIKIIKILYKEKKVKKEKIKIDILNVLPSLYTKSLESHISRLRKKLLSIDSSILIVSKEFNNLEII